MAVGLDPKMLSFYGTKELKCGNLASYFMSLQGSVMSSVSEPITNFRDFTKNSECSIEACFVLVALR